MAEAEAEALAASAIVGQFGVDLAWLERHVDADLGEVGLDLLRDDVEADAAPREVRGVLQVNVEAVREASLREE